MKKIFLLISLFAISCSSIKEIHTNYMDGTWIPVEQEFAGKQMPSSFFQNQQLIIKNNTYTVIAESVDKGELLVNNGKMDILGKEGPNVGKTIKAIYKFEKEKLIICYNLKGDSYPVDFSTKGHSMFFLSTFIKKE